LKEKKPLPPSKKAWKVLFHILGPENINKTLSVFQKPELKPSYSKIFHYDDVLKELIGWHVIRTLARKKVISRKNSQKI